MRRLFQVRPPEGQGASRPRWKVPRSPFSSPEEQRPPFAKAGSAGHVFQALRPLRTFPTDSRLHLPRYPASARIASMPKSLSAEDLFPLVDSLSPKERIRLLRFMSGRPAGDDRARYDALPPQKDEFSTDEEPLAWEAEGWENFA